MSSPTKLQILGAQIRAANEAFKKAKRKPYKGGYEIPPRKERDKHLSRLFGLPPHEISYFLTYSCSCDHEWSEGACPRCPEPNLTPAIAQRLKDDQSDEAYEEYVQAKMAGELD